MKKKILLLTGILCYSICSIQASSYINSGNSIHKEYIHRFSGSIKSNNTQVKQHSLNVTEKNMIKSKNIKRAFLDGIEYNGTYNCPDTLLYSDELTYEITVVNTDSYNSNTIIYDTIPDGLAVSINSISNKGSFNALSRVITWELHIPPGDSTQISYKARKISGTNNLMVNSAYINSNGEVQQTNSTFHKGALCKVTFAAGKNGSISNTSPQFIDYSSCPNNGIKVVPEPGYSFAGWNYPAYTDLKGFRHPAESGIYDYSWISIGNNIHLTANFDKEDYNIDYNLDDGTMGSLRNPANYTVTSEDITLKIPTKTNYLFIGWTGSNGPTPQKKITIPKGSTGDRIYNANWIEKKEANDKYYITYNYSKGIASEKMNPVYYTEIISDIILNAPSRPGYTFTEWTITSDAGNIGTTIGYKIPKGTTGNLTCTANWSLATFPLHYKNKGNTSTILPDNYNINELPIIIEGLPDKQDAKFVGWTGSNGEIPELSVWVPKETTGALNYKANWAFQFAEDTIFTCQLPVLLASGYDGMDYEWILPDGKSLRTEDIEADISGRYILKTNYGSMVVADTIVVLSFFENDLTIKNISKAGNKIDREQIFTVELNPLFKDAEIRWALGGGSPSAYTGDTAKVVYKSPGKKNINAKISVVYNRKTCNKELSYEIDIYPVNRSFFVNQHTSSGGLQDGSSWTNAFYTLQEALTEATEGDYIWVAIGDYMPDKNTSFFIEKDSVEIYGGFDGTEKFLSERDISKNPTFLNGANRSVIINSNVTGVHWDGFTIIGGASTQGGGILNNKASVTIANCIIRDNEAKEGGGIYSTESAPILYNVEISGNTAGKGGAMYNNKTNPGITNVTISGNLATTGGGLFNNENSDPVIRNTIIYENQAHASPSIYNENSTPYFSYSLIESSNGSGNNWNNRLGIDGSHNYDQKPMFKKRGFDDKGNMQTGNYELYSSSIAVNRGNNVCIYEKKIRYDQNLESPTDSPYVSLPYDLKGKERIISDYTDIGAYEYDMPEIDWDAEYPVLIPEVEGLITDPAGGEHLIKTHWDFTFTIKAKPGYTMDNITVKTGKPAWDENGGVEIVKNDDGSATVTIHKITSDMYLEINGINPVANETISNQQVWSYHNNLYVIAEKESWLKIYTITGQLNALKKIDDKINIINLDPGIYTVVLNDKSYKIIINN